MIHFKVLLEPGTPQGSKIISQMRSYILWMEKRVCTQFMIKYSDIWHIPWQIAFNYINLCFQKCRKSEKSTGAAPSKMKSIVAQEDLLKDGAFVVAPVSWNCKWSNLSLCSRVKLISVYHISVLMMVGVRWRIQINTVTLFRDWRGRHHSVSTRFIFLFTCSITFLSCCMLCLS